MGKFDLPLSSASNPNPVEGDSGMLMFCLCGDSTLMFVFLAFVSKVYLFAPFSFARVKPALDCMELAMSKMHACTSNSAAIVCGCTCLATRKIGLTSLWCTKTGTRILSPAHASYLVHHFARLYLRIRFPALFRSSTNNQYHR